MLYTDGYIYIKIKGNMYGLKQVSVLVYKNLFKILTVVNYTPIIGTSGL